MLKELGIETGKKQVDTFKEPDGWGTESMPEGVWDVHGNYEQMEAINYAVRSSCELAFEKVGCCSYFDEEFSYVLLNINQVLF